MSPKKGSKERREQAAKASAASAAQRPPSQPDEPAATATPAPATVTQEAAAAEPLEAADDMADERNAAAFTEKGAPEAAATSATSGGDDVAPLPTPLQLELAEEEETRAAYTTEVARVEAAPDARGALSQVGFAPLDPEDAMAVRMLAKFHKWTRETREEKMSITPNGKKHGRKRERGTRKGKRRGD